MEKVGISTLRENLSIFLKKVQKGEVITILHVVMIWQDLSLWKIRV